MKKREHWRCGYRAGLWYAELACEHTLGSLLLHGNDPGGHCRAVVERVKERIAEQARAASEYRTCICGGGKR